MIHYILQIIGFQLLFLLVYEVFLKKETFFNWNRVYLLLTPIVSLVLPLLKIPVLQQSIPENYKIALPEVLTRVPLEETVLDGGQLAEVTITGTGSVNLYTILTNIWYLGVLMGVLFFVYKLYKIWNLSSLGTSRKIDGIRVITLPNSTTAFSFFNTMYLGADLSEIQRKSIVMHEAVHIKERHSIDLLFFELLRIVFWFNPLVYIYQKELTLLQEFQADATAVLQTDKAKYYQELLAQVFQTEKISFINTFFNHSFIKKRIIMLQKSKSNRLAKFKYVLIAPLVCAMLFYVSCSEDEKIINPVGATLVDLRASIEGQNVFILSSTIKEGQPDFYTMQVMEPQNVSKPEEQFIEALGNSFKTFVKPLSENYDGTEREVYTFKGYSEFAALAKKYGIPVYKMENFTNSPLGASLTSKEEVEIIEQVPSSELENIPNFTVTTSLQKGKPSLLTVILRDKSLLTEGELDFVKAAKKAEVVLDSKDMGKGDFSQNDEFFLVRSSPFLQKLAIEKGVTIEVVSLTNNQDQTYDIERVSNSDLEDIPYSVIDKVPTYPGCTGTNEELKACMSDAISKYVNQSFNTGLGESLGLNGVNRIFVSFRIDKAGRITNIRSRAPHPDLEKEANRVIRLIPDMEKPGEQGGRPVGVLYSLPITFNIEE